MSFDELYSIFSSTSRLSKLFIPCWNTSYSRSYEDRPSSWDLSFIRLMRSDASEDCIERYCSPQFRRGHTTGLDSLQLSPNVDGRTTRQIYLEESDNIQVGQMDTVPSTRWVRVGDLIKCEPLICNTGHSIKRHVQLLSKPEKNSLTNCKIGLVHIGGFKQQTRRDMGESRLKSSSMRHKLVGDDEQRWLDAGAKF